MSGPSKIRSQIRGLGAPRAVPGGRRAEMGVGSAAQHPKADHVLLSGQLFAPCLAVRLRRTGGREAVDGSEPVRGGVGPTKTVEGVARE